MPVNAKTKPARLAAQALVMQIARKRTNTTQAALADRLKVKLDTWRSWEYGQRRIPADMLVKVASALEVAPAGLSPSCPHCGRPY